MHPYSDNSMSKNDLETQDLIRTNEDYFSLFPEFVPYSDEFFFDSPILESYSTDTTSSSPMLQQEDGFFKPLVRKKKKKVHICLSRALTIFFFQTNRKRRSLCK